MEAVDKVQRHTGAEAQNPSPLDDINPFLCTRPSPPQPIVTRRVAAALKLPADLDSAQAVETLQTMSTEDVEARGLTKLAPPENVHWMGRKTGVFLDLRGADELMTALTAGGLSLKPGGRYLDFGCSSGRTLRTFQVAYPDGEWHGADPDPVTINWAQDHLRNISFITSSQLPPLPYGDDFLDGVYAISVWSHFREDAAIAWFNEMRRVIRPGGFLVFTTPAYAKYANRLRARPDAVERLSRRIKQFNRTGFVFVPSFEKRGNRNLDTAIWGAAQVSLVWVVQHLVGAWSLRSMTPAGNRGQQDIYVLQRPEAS